MFTVVIAEKEHLQNIEKYRFFLNPLFDSKQVAFCEWRPYEKRILDAVPDLVKTVAGHRQWRAVVVADEEGLEQRNPFDRVDYDPESRIASYHQSVENALMRLVTPLVEWPMEEGGINGLEGDADYALYIEESRTKTRIRKDLVRNQEIKFILPSEIICIAKRTYRVDKSYVDDVWVSHYEEQYSDFAERNMYFDKMRFIIFDIEDRRHKDYGYDYLKFLYTLMLIAQNEAPKGALKANRVYRIELEFNEDELKRFLDGYDKKLISTESFIRKEIKKIEDNPIVYLTDEEAEKILEGDVTIPISVTGDLKKEDTHIKLDPGMAVDCPEDEMPKWISGVSRVKEILKQMNKRIRHALQKAAGSFKDMNRVENESAGRMQEHQVIDLKDKIAKLELDMASMELPELYKNGIIEEYVDEEDKNVRREIRSRMKKKTTVIAGIVGLITVVLGFLPMIIGSFSDFRADGFIRLMIFMAAALGAVVIAGLLILNKWKRSLRVKNGFFNRAVDKTFSDVERDLSRYAQYLGYACNVMRGNSVINDYYEKNAPEQRQIRIYKKHIADIRDMREGLYDTFGDILNPARPIELYGVDPYEYDFKKSMDYKYPADFDKDLKRTVSFMQVGNEISVPLNFIEGVKIVREELYD